MQDLSQVMVKFSCVTDDTCCRVHNTLQTVSDRLRGPGKYSIALVVVVVVTFFNHNFVNCEATLILAIKIYEMKYNISLNDIHT